MTRSDEPVAVPPPDTAEFARLAWLDRRVLRLDDLPDSEIEAMAQAELPAEYRYCLTDIPD